MGRRRRKKKAGKGRGAPAKGREPAGLAAARAAEREIVAAQMEVVDRFRERARALAVSVEDLSSRCNTLVAEGRGRARGAPALEVMGRLAELEEEWEALQRGFNREAEEVVEDYLARRESPPIDPLEVCRESRVLEEAVQGLVQELERTEERLEALAGMRRLVAPEGSGRSPSGFGALLSALILLSGFGLGAFLGWREGVGREQLLFSLGPPLAAVLLVFSLRRRR